LFYDWIVGPYGSSKTTALFFKLVYMAGLQEPGSDGIRHSRAVVVRNTASQLKDTTLNSWNYWFKDGIHGTWRATDKIFILKLGDIECEVLFRPLDTPDDVARVLSLEVTFAIIDEFVQIPREIIEALSGRLGRYPSNKDGGATNYGMWGASNPDTEDNWWYEHLHDTTTVQQIINLKEDTPRDNRNVRYYRQPSGLSPEAENLCNLPPYDCSNQYYTDLARGKSEAWINQFIHAMWGFTVRGKPVVPTFKPDMHISKKPLTFNPYLPLIIGIDPGLGGSALIFGQEDSYGRLLVLGELVQSGYGAERIISERLKPYLRRRFADADIYFAPDPAADNRSQTDEKSVVDVFRRHWPHRVKIETNNRLPKRLDAIESYTTRLTEAGPALLIDEKECPNLVRALRGGWRFELLGRGDINKPVPEKNASSHVGDAFGYLCRYFHRQNERGLGYTKHERVPINPQFASRGVNYNWKPVI
jgi:hypothetical protein